MAKEKPSKAATSYVQRLLEDEYVHGQLRDAAAGLRSAYWRARKAPAQASEDKKLYDNVRQAVLSMRKAVTAIKRRPEPAPKRRIPKIAAAMVVVGGSVLVISARSQKQPGPPSTSDAATGPALDPRD